MVCLTKALVALTALAAPATVAKYCSGSPDPDAVRNTHPILTGEPTFVRKVANASLWTVPAGGDGAASAVKIVHLYAEDGYNRGYAHGELMKDDVNLFIDTVYEDIIEELESDLEKVPKEFRHLVAELGARAALGATFAITKKYTGQYFIDEMQGLADASGVSFEKVRDVHMIGELTKGSCSMIGAWGDATVDGSVLQLRALDWNSGPPFADFPQITVYHVKDEGGPQGYSFANVGWTAWLGSITGMSAHQTGISEIGVSFPDATWGAESRFGVPFTFLLRDLLQWDYTLEDSIKHIQDADRTCNLILGIGDGKVTDGSAPFRSVEYSHTTANFFTDSNMMPRNDTWHPRMHNVVYHAMDWLCPTFSKVMATQITSLHGALTPEAIVRDVTSITTTGNALVAVYDLTKDAMLVSYSRGTNMTGELNAHARPFTHIDMKKVFATPY